MRAVTREAHSAVAVVAKDSKPVRVVVLDQPPDTLCTYQCFSVFCSAFVDVVDG